MPYSYNQYTGDGSTQQFSISFQYISRDHIEVFLDGVETEDFTFLSDTIVTLNTAPANGVIVRVARNTPKEERLVDFVDGSTLQESDLDTSATQQLFIAQEAFDTVDDTVKQDTDGFWDAQNTRMKNLSDPVNAQDAATKTWVENLPGSSIADAVAARDKAQEWAEENEDVEVETGQYSAKHHALKAAASAALLPQNNFSATSNPTVSDDSSQGYSVGSRWVNVTLDESFICVNNANGTAVWVNSSLTSDELGALAILDTIATAQIDNDAVTGDKLDNTGVTAGAYNPVLGITVDAQGRVTDISSGSSGRQLIDRQVFSSSSGTWTKPAGCNAVKVIVVGGGGGGGGASSTSGATGGPGGTSSFGSHCSASGGGGGKFFLRTRPDGEGTSLSLGGIGSNGDINLRGETGGQPYFCRTYNNNSSTAYSARGGNGGSSILGGGGRSGAPNANTTHADGIGAGGGGTSFVSTSLTTAGCGGSAGGAAIKFIESGLGTTETVTVGSGGSGGNTTYDGGNGGPGIVIVESYT